MADIYGRRTIDDIVSSSANDNTPSNIIDLQEHFTREIENSIVQRILGGIDKSYSAEIIPLLIEGNQACFFEIMEESGK